MASLIFMDRLPNYRKCSSALSGKAEKLSLHTKGHEVADRHTTGPYPVWTVENTFTENEIMQMKTDGITVSPVSANEAYIALTNRPKGGIDDVFN